jgi:predicted restriction endonuclease
MRDYLDPRYKAWRLAVRRRDKNQCQWPLCKVKRKLQTHHIKPWSKFPWLRFELDNGITLCKRHHLAIRGKEIYYMLLFNTIIASKKCSQ